MTSESLNEFNLESLARSIRRITDELSIQASKAVNVSLTVRNWLIGHYIAEFELNGSDRAAYGDKLLDRLAGRLVELDVPTCDKRRLYQYLRFYQTYPSIVRSLTAQSRKLLLSEVPESASSGKVRSLTAQLQTQLLQALSYTHFELLVAIEDDGERSYYETECIKGGWSVRELKRQINSLLYERSGLSTDPAKLADQTHTGAEQASNALTVRDPYVSWYDRNVRTADDNPPVGILLCTEKDRALVEYALAGMDNSLFVSRYQLELPSREVLQRQIEQERQQIESALGDESP